MLLHDEERIPLIDIKYLDLQVLSTKLKREIYLASRFPADQAIVTFTAVSSSFDSNKA